MVLGGAWSVSGSTGWFVVVMGQYGAVLVGTWWYWASIGQSWLVCGDKGRDPLKKKNVFFRALPK